MPTKSDTATKAAPVRKPRKSKAELRAEAEKAQQASWAEFETRRHSAWLELWTKAMRLALVTASMLEFRESNDWWFRDFHVNARDQSFKLDETGDLVISEEKLHPSDEDRINSALDYAFKLLKDFEDEKERKRLEAIELERKRQEALGKLSDEEKKILGLPLR
jgi:hypothetical protein